MSFETPASSHVKYNEAINFVLDLIETNLSEKFTYHTSEHTRSVIAAAENIGKSEGVGDKSLRLLMIAAAWHDCGYLGGNVEHEEASCLLVKKHLPDFGFSKNQIDTICKMIYSM